MNKNIIEDLLKDHQASHSEFQIDNFIIGAQGDEWAMYKQVLREIASRSEILIASKEDLDLFKSRIYIMWPFGKRARINRARKQRQLQAMEKNISEVERELNRFVEIAVQLKNRIGEIDFKRRQALEANSWRNKARKMAGIDLMLPRIRLSKVTMEMILALPADQQQYLLMELCSNPNPLNLIGSDGNSTGTMDFDKTDFISKASN